MLGRAGSWVGSGGSAGGKYVRTTRFVSIGSSTSGTVTLPSGSQVVLDDFGGTVDAVVLQISGGKPLKVPALDALGSVIAATFDASGNWTFTGTPVAYPVALVYRVQQTLTNFDSTSADIWGESEVFGAATAIITYNFDGGPSVPNTGTYGYITIPYDCTITYGRLLANLSGSAVVEVWRKAYASFPPASGDKISASAPLTLTAQQNSQDTTLTGWTTALKAGDVLAFNINSIATLTRLNLTLGVKRV